MKKLSALALALVLMLTAAAPVMAAGGKPSANDTATATVKDVSEGLTVTAYQVVKADYDDNGFSGYSEVREGSIKDPTAPTADEIAKLAANTTGLPMKSMTGAQNAGVYTYTADLNAGYWVVLVTGSDIIVYNPLLVGVYYSVSGSDNTMTSNPVSAKDDWSLDSDIAYAKSTDPQVKKEIVKSDNTTAKGDDIAAGETVKYQVTATMPSYSSQYKAPKVKITDTLNAALSYVNNSLSVTVGGTEVTASAATYTATASGQSIEINFASDFILENGGKDIVVTYQAKLSETSYGYNYDPNENTVALEYSNDPSTSSSGVKKDRNYVYTFGINAALSVNGGGGGTIVKDEETTTEIVKVDGTKYKTEYTYEEVTTTTASTYCALGEAEFTLYKSDHTTVVAVEKTDEKGAVSFTGLDAGTYYLVETAAPDGFTVDSTPHKVVIAADYEENGRLHSYSITIDDVSTSTYTATYTADPENSENTEVTINKSTTITYLKNTMIATLPSTGGMGTYLFTIIGVAVMAVAAGLFLARRRRQA